MKPYLLTALGSLLWLIFLAAGIRELLSYGLYVRGELDQGVVALLVVPPLLIAGTVALGLRANRGNVPARLIVASTLVAAFGFLLCLSALLRGA
ncbi:hypothetical protein HNP52_004065 [Sphingomonas kyeonggiensis]|uniref:Uncharacterized protein n=1 Tax=Sphingomonas kyeonggiensis TaxID=1268553 RepID=A0A7W7K4R8_9SPHN|nr:hypothetical protein [Sphingomonas kyeonggiensis]MBB4840968.1 hypothetical protein [Sphingomonas kyeonggiensis]